MIMAALLVASCDTPHKVAFRKLSGLGVEPSGRSLIQSILEGNDERTALLLEAGVYTEQRDARDRTPLGIAVENRDYPMVLMLLNSSANVNATLANGASVLGIALEHGDGRVVETLLASGARTDSLMPDGDPILPWAIRRGRLDLVRTMMKAGADPHLKDGRGNPLLHVAMESGRRDLTESLVELGADAGAINAAGETTIQLALKQGWTDMIPKLASAGADPNAAGPDGRTFLEKAVADEDVEKAALFLRIGADPNLKRDSSQTKSPFEDVLEHGSPALFTTFLKSSARPPGGDWNHWFWRAYRQHDPRKAAMLLSHGIRPDRRSPGSLSPVETAVLEGRSDFVKLLLDYGLPGGRSLYFASVRGNHEMVGLLLACGVPADFTMVPSFDTALSGAIRARHDKAAEWLVRYGADPRHRIPEGQSTFHLAVATGCHRTVKLLLESGANPNAPFALPVSSEFLRQVRPGAMRWVLKMDRNATPLMLAADLGSIQTARYLLKTGAKLDVHTRISSLWPINFAIQRKDVAMTRLFLGQDPRHEERCIEVRLSEQMARMFDAEGNEIFTTRVSTGRKGFSTPVGEYVITNKHRDWTSTLYHASMPYFQRLNCGDFGLHEGNVPGYPASHGCIRVPAGNAAKLFGMTKTGDRVSILP